MKRIISLLLTIFITVAASYPGHVFAQEKEAKIVFSPTDGPSGEISYTSPLKVSFSDTVDPSTVNADTVKLYKDGFDVEIQRSDLEVSGADIMVNCQKSPYCTYILEIRNGILSKSGNKFGEDVLYKFETCVNEYELKLTSSNFLSAVYLPSDPDHTGNRKSSSGGSGWLPYLYAGGTYRHYYCIIDISSLEGKNITQVTYKPFMNGSVNASLYEIDGDFTPGTTPYSQLPQYGDVFATISEAAGNGKYVDIDITSQVKKLLSEGKTRLKFMLKQNVGNQSSIANESSQWSDGSWGPGVVVKYTGEDFYGVKNTVPKALERSFSPDQCIEIYLGSAVQSVEASNLNLQKEHSGETVDLSESDFTYDEESNIITITPPMPLSPTTVYSLCISGLESSDSTICETKKILFRTDGDESDYNPVYSNESGTSFADVSISSDYSGKLCVSGKLFDCAESVVNLIIAKSDSDTENPVFSATSVTNKNGYYSFEVQLTDGGEYRAYVSSPYYLGKALISDVFTCYSAAEYAHVWSCLSSGDAQIIKGVIDTAYDMFEIFENKEEIFERNDYVSNLLADEPEFGDYTAENISAARDAIYDAYLISGFSHEKDVDILIDAFEKYASECAIDKIDNYSFYSNMNDEYKRMTVSDFADQIKNTTSSFEEICETFSKSIQTVRLQAIFDKIKEASNYAQVSEIIKDESNSELLELSQKDIDKFKKNEKNAAKALAGQDFKDIDDFKKAFNKSIDTEDKRTTGGGGGSSTIKGTPNVSITAQTPPSDSQQQGNTQTSSPDTYADNIYSFDDISDYDWAKKEIEFLYRMGVIDGIAQRRYAPAENLSREQFVKLITEAFEFEMTDSPASFDDVSPDDWFYAYVSSAEALGITRGNGQSFGRGQSITREDLCVMTVRALNAAGYKTEECELNFTDGASVSQYAKSAVAYLSKEGIIKGMPDGTFMPHSKTTRAEAAVIMYRLSEYIKNFSATIWTAPLTALDTVEAPTEAKILSDIKSKLNPKNISHPYIHGTRAKLEEIKTNLISGDEDTKRLYALVKESADELLDTSVITHNNAVSQQHTSVEGRILALMTTYFVEGDQKYLNRAMEEFTHLQKITKWTADAQLDNTQTAAAIAICYDWLYDYLSDEQKSWAISSIKEKCVDIAYEYYKDPSKLSSLRAENDNMNIWCWRGSYNHCVYNNSNLAIAALALAPDYPEYCAFVLYNNMYNIQPYFELVGSEGGHEEPVGYYGYTTGKAMNMLSAIQSALGTMYDYDRYSGFRTTAYYPLYMYGVGPFAFGDCSPAASEFNSNFLYFAAKHSKNAELLSLINDRLTSSNSAKVLLWYDKGELNNIEEGLTLSLDKKLSPVSMKQNVAVFRNSWNKETGFYAAMYTGNGNANGHSDPVSGAFGIDAFGERFITPMGLGNYDYPDYWDNSQSGGRWNWYEKRPEGNNCLVINPSTAVGQDVDTTAVFDDFASGEGAAYAVTDLTKVYDGYAASYKRGIKIHDNRSKIVIQDEALMAEPSEIFWSVNTPGQIEILDSSTALITLNGKKLALKVWANVDFELGQMAAERLPTSPQNPEQRVLRAYRKIYIKANNVTELNLMAEFIPVSTEAEIPEQISDFVAIDNWTADEALVPKPVLTDIQIDGQSIDGFNGDVYNYNIKYDSIPTQLPTVVAKADNNTETVVTYPEGDVKKAVIEVKSSGRTSYYEILFTLKPKEIDINSLTKYDFSAITATDNDGNIPENVGDNDMSTRWSASGEGQKPCLDIDLGSAKNIKAIGIAFYEGAKRQSYFEIYTSDDGQSWTKQIVLGESSGKSSEFEYFELNAKARYVRYEGQQNSLNHWNSVTEIQLYGE